VQALLDGLEAHWASCREVVTKNSLATDFIEYSTLSFNRLVADFQKASLLEAALMNISSATTGDTLQ
jgi:hypothetical protein